MNMQKVVENLKYVSEHVLVTYDIDKEIAFLENEMKYPTREETLEFIKLNTERCELRKKEEQLPEIITKPILGTLKIINDFINTSKEQTK